MIHNAEGLQYAKEKNYPKALEAFKAAIAEDSAISLYHNNISNVYIALGNLEKARQHLNEALRLDPFVAEIYNNFGRLFYKQGLVNESIPYFEKALRMNSEYWEAHYNLAHSYAKKNRFFDAAAHYREAIRLNPEHITAHFNLACAAVAIGNFLEAYTHFKLTVELDPTDSEALKQLGEVAVQLGKKEEAINAYQHYLTLNPNDAEIEHNLAVLYLRDEERTKALEGFKKAFSLNPNNITAKHMFFALSGEQVAERAPQEYIENLFDQYADYYNDQVKNKLHYNVPGLMRNSISQFLGSNPKAGCILDLGCGTGLCGVYFRDLAREMIGIDLSSQMIAKAKLLDTYDELIQSDIEAYLKKIIENNLNSLENQDEVKINNTVNLSKTQIKLSSNPMDDFNVVIDSCPLMVFDMILAGDVFVYIGDLSFIFQSINKILKSKGFFIFTVEVNDAEDYYLQNTGRFAHSSSYIHNLCEDSQLQIVLENDIVPRKNDNKDIPGRLYILKRRSDHR